MQDQQRNKTLTEINNIEKAKFLNEENAKEVVKDEQKVFIKTFRMHSRDASKADGFRTDPLK
jgi:hypothetical protein